VSQDIGIWLDHEKAFVATIDKDDLKLSREIKENITRIESEVEKHLRLSGGSRSRKTPYGPQDIAAEGKMDARRRNQLDDYYERIIQAVQNAKKILIFGPGNAKKELEKKIKKSKEMAPKVLPLETTDKMTERQILAKTRKFFSTYP